MKRACIRQTWRNRHNQWEKSIELTYAMQAAKKPQHATDPLGILVKAYRNVTPPDAMLGK
jgi:hypothetical protein